MSLKKLSDLEKIIKADVDEEILHSAISYEMEAIKQYEHMFALSNNKDIKALILIMLDEGNSRLERLKTLLEIIDQEQKRNLEDGAKKIQEMLSEHESAPKSPEEKQPEKQLTKQSNEIPKTKKPEINEKEQKRTLGDGVKKVQEMLSAHKSDSKLPEEKHLSKQKDDITETDKPVINAEEKKRKSEEVAKKFKEMLSAHEPVSKLPEAKQPEKQLYQQEDEIPDIEEPEIEKEVDIDPPETKKSSRAKMKHESGDAMLCTVCNNKVTAKEPIRCPSCGAPPGRLKRI